MPDVLLVDDHPDLQDVLRQLLEIHGHSAYLCETAELALKYLGENIPLAVLADERLPGMSGVQLTEQIRRDPRLANVPIIICSADDSNRDAAIAAGATDFWLKGTDDFFEAVQHLSNRLPNSARRASGNP